MDASLQSTDDVAIDPSMDELAAERSPAPGERSLVVEQAGLRTMLGYQDAWADLAERALDPNIFLEPGFALPLIQHIGPGRRPMFVMVWEESEPTAFGRLVGLLPVAQRLMPGDRLARGFSHPQICLGQPLIDRDVAAEVWGALLSWLGAGHARLGLRLQRVPRDSLFFQRFIEPALGTSVHVLGEHHRACLLGRAADAAAALGEFRSAKRRKETRRQRRRMEERGDRRFVSAATPLEIRSAAERFLALEYSGWKGDRGGALLEDAGLATFTRSMTRLLADEGKCRIDSLEVDGRPVAIGIVITTHGRAHFWKTAFDERFAALSPGVQLALEITDAQLSDASVLTTDSCAAPNHPMIDRLWPDRIALVDVAIDLHPDEPTPFHAVYAIERAAMRARAGIKRIVLRVRRSLTRGSARRGAGGVSYRGRWTGSGSTSGSGSPAS